MSDTEKRNAVLKKFYERSYEKTAGRGELDDLIIDAMTDHIVRLERILDKLREPSFALEAAGHQAYVIKIGQIYADEGHVARHHQTLAINSAIRAAVATAEQEVGRE